METKLKDNSISNDIKEIGKDGDIVLVVGCNERKLQVHSLFLKTASKVFRAILGPHFSEGQDLSSDNPKEIFLSEDDADAVQTICEVIHLRHDAASQILTGAQILQIAITADIYDCNDALKNASGYWLKHNGTDAEELKYFMAASYLFDDAQAFKETTAALILHHVSSYITLVKGDIEAILPWRIFCKQFHASIFTIPIDIYT